jgi:hypothetical protein
MKKKALAIIITLSICIMLIVAVRPVSTPQSETLPNPKFVIASWDFPDEYGQGIYGFFVLENSTGDFIPLSSLMTYPSNSTEFTVNASIALGLDVRVRVNYTLLNLTEYEEGEYDGSVEYHPGLAKLRLSAIVRSTNRTIIFSQQNFTYDYFAGKVEPGIWWYSEKVYFDFVTQMGEIYTATVIYEVYW